MPAPDNPAAEVRGARVAGAAGTTAGRASDADEQRFRAIGAELVSAVERSVPSWIVSLVLDRVERAGAHADEALRSAAEEAGASAAAEVGSRLRQLLALDLDAQDTSPLAVVRTAASHAHGVLAEAGIPAPERDPFVLATFPDDTYDLSPASWADIDPSLHELGLTWGAAKAFVFKARRRAEGRFGQ